MYLPDNFYNNRKLENLVENRTTFTVESAELNVYETHHYAEEVILQFHQPVFASMIEGKKVMHLRDTQPFEFVPGESILMPANEIMKIDFPEADMKNPTKCLAMVVSPDKIRRVVSEMNVLFPRSDHREWTVSDANFSFTNDVAIAQIIQRLVFLFGENHPSKDFFVDMTLRELIVRVLQTENRTYLSNHSRELSTTNRLAAVIEFIRENLHLDLSVTDLAGKACMSESNFHKVFKSELGVTPVQFINEERIRKAMRLLRNPEIQVKEVYLACGFNNISYFIRTFKKKLDMTPGEYQAEHFR